MMRVSRGRVENRDTHKTRTTECVQKYKGKNKKKQKQNNWV
jgi:hypothetical protein